MTSPLILRLDLPFRGRGRALMADGTESLFDVYEGAVLWEGRGGWRIAKLCDPPGTKASRIAEFHSAPADVSLAACAYGGTAI